MKDENLKFENISGEFIFKNTRVASKTNYFCCDNVCRQCGICFHNMECLCYDYQVRSLICKHIHAVAIKNPMHIDIELNSARKSSIKSFLEPENINMEDIPDICSE